MNTLAKTLQAQLFFAPAENVFALLDGASVPSLLAQLEQHQPEYDCLFRGQLSAELAAAAPYLVRIEKDSAFLTWLLEQGYGRHWGIFVTAPTHLRTLRHHFRNLLTVQDEDGKTFLFRFYDPRVLRVYLPTCLAEEKQQFFGPVTHYFIEGDEDVFGRFSL